PIPSRLALAPCLVASEPERPSPLEPDAANHRPMVASRSRVPPLSPEATWRHYLRQEPDAGKPLVRICAGGYEQSWFLLRPRKENERPGAKDAAYAGERCF